jgi:spermidine synthase
MSFNRLLSYFYPQKVATYESSVSGPVEVYSFQGSVRVVADGLTQSGGLVTTLWSTALEDAQSKYFKSYSPQGVLILGYGSGSAALVARKLWPKAKITGIEIDPVMIELGEKYIFPTKSASTPGVNIIQTDAFTYLDHNRTKYDLIINDLYLGSVIPPKSYSRHFINNIKRSLSDRGCALFNVFATKKNSSQAEAFKQMLISHFPFMTRLHTISNWIFLVAKSPVTG